MNSNEVQNNLLGFNALSSELMNNSNKSLVNFYEQMLLQRNMAIIQHQQKIAQPSQLQIQAALASPTSLNPSGASASSSTSSLLTISSKHTSPSNSPSHFTNSPISSPISQFQSHPSTDYESKYRAYMMNAAAAFPYSIFGLTTSVAQHQMPAHLNHLASFQQANTLPQSSLNYSNLFSNSLNNFQENQFQHSQPIPQQQQQQQLPVEQNTFKIIKSEEPKPVHSYIGLIALAILSTPEKKLVLSDIYQWILDNYLYFRNRGSGWRNSIRHNLSLNDCFMKSGRSANGKGHYWTIHPANLEDFSRGDFRRRRAQRRVRRSLGLTIPEEDEEDDDILTPPSSLSPLPSKSTPNNSNNNHSNNQANISNNNLSSNSSCSSTNSGNDYNQSLSQLEKNYSNHYDTNNGSMKRSLPCEEIDSRKKFKQYEQGTNDASFHSFVSPGENKHEQNDEADYENDTTNDSQQSEFGDGLKKSTDSSINNNESSFESDTISKTTTTTTNIDKQQTDTLNNKKRSFNVDALLAPDTRTELEQDVGCLPLGKRFKTNENPEQNEPECKTFAICSTSPNVNSNLSILPGGFIHEESFSKSSPNNLKSSQNSPKLNKAQANKATSKSSLNSTANRSSLNNNCNNNKQMNTLFEQNSPFSKIESNNLDVEKWKQTFSKIMARSYKNNNNQSNLISPNKK